jgi:hypothetical protein
MPENPVLVVNLETNDYTYMHSIDASEAVKIGDHRYATIEEQHESSEKKATARNRMRNVNVNPPPELQTPDQRQATRAQAAEEAAAAAEGRPVEPLGVRQAMGAPTVPAPAAPPTPPPTPQAEESSRRGRS